MTGLRIGSLFSGYNGLDMAVEAITGATTAWVSDIDKGACKILAHRSPAPNLGDITTIDWTTVEPIDILTGGFPCQDLSHAGKRAGLKAGTRSGLWSHMAQAIDALKPRMVVAENVRGLLSAEAPSEVEPCAWCLGEGPSVDLRALGIVLADLAELGYDAQWVGLRAADVGACHGRFRIFLIAQTADAASDRWDEGRPEPTRLVGRPDAPERGDDSAADTRGEAGQLGAGLREAEPAGNGRRQSPRSGRPDELELLGTPRASEWKGTGPVGSKSHTHRLERDYLDAQVLMLPTPTATDAKASGGGYTGQSNVTLTDAAVRQLDRFGDYAAAIARWEPVIGRPAPNPTEPTGRNGALRLSPPFVEWMMGLPEGWVTDVPDLTRNESLKALGNGVVPQQAEAALRYMLTVERAA